MPTPKSTRKTTRRNRKAKKSDVAAPSAMSSVLTPAGYSITSVNSGHVRVRGHEMVSVVSGTGLTPTLAAVVDCNPACWTNSRLSLVARAYERYRFNSITVEYISGNPTTLGGNIVIAAETDPNEPIPTGAGAMQKALNNQYSCLGPLWENMKFTFKRDPSDHQWYYASQAGEGSREAVTQLVLYAITSSGSVNSGNLLVHYDVEFIYPELEFVDGGAQYSATSLNFSSTAADAVLQFVDPGTPFSKPGAKIMEFRPTADLPSTYLGPSTGSWFDALAGCVLYIALVSVAGGTVGTYQVFNTLEAAKTLSNPLKWTGTGVGTIAGFYRTLISSLNVR